MTAELATATGGQISLRKISITAVSPAVTGWGSFSIAYWLLTRKVLVKFSWY